MAMNEDFNFSELCRLCSLKSNNQLHIFDKEGEQRQLLFKIRTCIPAVVTKEDALPKNICQRCAYKLEMFYEFHISCMATDTVLKNYAESLKQLAASVHNQSTFPSLHQEVSTHQFTQKVNLKKTSQKLFKQSARKPKKQLKRQFNNSHRLDEKPEHCPSDRRKRE